MEIIKNRPQRRDNGPDKRGSPALTTAKGAPANRYGRMPRVTMETNTRTKKEGAEVVITKREKPPESRSVANANEKKGQKKRRRKKTEPEESRTKGKEVVWGPGKKTTKEVNR